MLMCVYPMGADLNNRGMGTTRVIDNRTQKVKRVEDYDQYTHKGATVKNVFIPDAASPGQIVKRIIAAKPAGKMLTILKLVSHGDTGMLFLSGTGDHPPRLPLTHLNIEEFAELRPHFDPLRSAIHLHACGVASDTSINAGGPVDSPNTIPGSWKGGTGLGYKLLDRMAVLTGIPTMAAIDVQLYLNTVFKGKTVCVEPTGRAWLSWEEKSAHPAVRGGPRPS